MDILTLVRDPAMEYFYPGSNPKTRTLVLHFSRFFLDFMQFIIGLALSCVHTMSGQASNLFRYSVCSELLVAEKNKNGCIYNQDTFRYIYFYNKISGWNECVKKHVLISVVCLHK